MLEIQLECLGQTSSYMEIAYPHFWLFRLIPSRWQRQSPLISSISTFCLVPLHKRIFSNAGRRSRVLYIYLLIARHGEGECYYQDSRGAVKTLIVRILWYSIVHLEFFCLFFSVIFKIYTSRQLVGLR